MTIPSKKAVFALLSVFLIMLLSGCGTDKSASAPEKPKNIVITYVKAPLNVPSIIEKRLGLFEKEFAPDKIKVELPEITVGPKQTEALAAGSVDFAHGLGGTSAIMAAANGVDLKIIGIYSRAPKAFVLMAKDPSLTSIADLKGKKVAGPKGTVLHQLLLTALAKSSLKPDDIQFITMDIPGAIAALMNGSVDFALAAGPDALRAEKAGARVITTGEGLIEATIVTAVRGEFLKQHPDLVKRFIKVHQNAQDYLKTNLADALQMAATETGLTMDMVKQMYPWYDFNAAIKPTDIEELKRTQDFLIKHGMQTKAIVIEDLIVKL